VDLDEPVQGLQELLMADSGAALQKQNKAAEMSVRGVLTAMSVKIPITKLLKMAILHLKLLLLLTMAVAMWKATNYILGDYEVKVLRENIKLL
jgi:hypothetical protein